MLMINNSWISSLITKKQWEIKRLLSKFMRNINIKKRRNTSKRRWSSKIFTLMITMSSLSRAGLQTKKQSPKYRYINNWKSIQMLFSGESMLEISLLVKSRTCIQELNFKMSIDCGYCFCFDFLSIIYLFALITIYNQSINHL